MRQILLIIPPSQPADQPCTISSYSGLMASKILSTTVSRPEWHLPMPPATGERVALFSMFFLLYQYQFFSNDCHSCQCGISRSATMIIAIVMRAAAEHAAWVPPEVWALKGMQEAYSYVKEKSPCVGPNMSYVICPILCYFINLFIMPVLSIN